MVAFKCLYYKGFSLRVGSGGFERNEKSFLFIFIYLHLNLHLHLYLLYLYLHLYGHVINQYYSLSYDSALARAGFSLLMFVHVKLQIW